MRACIHSNHDLFRNIKVLVKNKNKKKFIYILIIKNLLTIFIEWICEKIFLSKVNNTQGHIFLDTFLTPGRGLTDRYYANYEKYLSDENKKNIIISPVLIGFKNPLKLINIFRLISKSDKNIVIHNHFLRIKDRFKSLFQSMQYSSRNYKTPDILGLNIESLCIDQLKNDFASERFIVCLNTMRFVELLQQHGYKFRTLINWNENQDIDKALNLSFHFNFPECWRKGYRGYVQSEFENEKILLGCEGKKHLLPNEVIVIGDSMKESITKFYSDIKVSVGPALRYEHIFFKENYNNFSKSAASIYIALPISLSDSEEILSYVFRFFSENNGLWQAFVKPHPTHKNSVINHLMRSKKESKFITITDRNFYDKNLQVDILITGASSIALEAVSLGKAVIICSSSKWLSKSPIPKKLKNINFFEVSNYQDFRDSLEDTNPNMVNSDQNQEIFMRPTHNSVSKLFKVEK